MRLLLLAPPGAGKGTQGERLAAWSGARHIAAGDLLRAEAQAGGRLGREIAAYQARGDLVPDQIVLDVLTPAVVEAAAEGGYILDGFPRTLPQATAAAELAARLGVTLDAAIYLHAPEEVLTRRLLDRASQSGRSDDKADVIRHRLQVFAETTGPLVPYYTERGILVAVDADQPPETVTADIQARLSGLSLTGTLPGAAGQSCRLSYPVAGSPDGLKFLARRPGYGLSPPAGSHAEVAVGIDFSRDEGVRPIRVFRWSACERSPLATPGSPLTD